MAEEQDYQYINDDKDNSWDNWETMLEWRDIWLKAIALAWSNEEFKTLLLKDAREAFLKYFGYHLPKQVDFWVVDVANQTEPVTFKYPLLPEAKASKSGFGWYAVPSKEKKGSRKRGFEIKSKEDFEALLKDPDLRTQWVLPRSLLVYPLPPKPAEEIQAVAVADFSAAGRTYPFTTC